jgi:hypothetical protein
MERALEEGKRFDQEMTQLAETEVNPAMLGQDEESEGEEKGGETELGEEGREEEGGGKGSSRKKQGGGRKSAA